MTIQKISTVAAALVAGVLLTAASAQAQPDMRRDDRRPPPMRQDRRAPPPRVMDAHRPPMAVGRPMPSAYRGYNYRVDNWQHYHLRRPDRGQYWVQYGGQFMLLSPAGVVLQIFVP
ncbi:MAG: RcnB family protein [Burkholderiaceae bacterium]|jgi:Ni/Co efflux regulator RcnB|nr:RcnB family protein [Burkholderiaceae bacterium]